MSNKNRWERNHQRQVREFREALLTEAARIRREKANVKISIGAFVTSVYGVAPQDLAEASTEASRPVVTVAPAGS